MSCARKARGVSALAAAFFSFVIACCVVESAGAVSFPLRDEPESVTPEEAERQGFVAQSRHDDRAAVRWLERAARANRPASQMALGMQYFDGKGVAKDVVRAVQLAKAAASQGVASAQSFLGWAYLTGTGVEADPVQAVQWLTAAARQEDPYALRELGRCYYEGVGTKRDAERSRQLTIRAGELGDPDARLAWAGWLVTGGATYRDVPRGISVLTRSVRLKDFRAAFVLGKLYLGSEYVPVDQVAAAQWFKVAADEGHVAAMLWLSELHFKGIGVKHDEAQAEKLLKGALARADLGVKNQFAWELAVGEVVQLRDGELAIRVLEPALAAAEKKAAGYIDTLAAAYATANQFDKAVATQRLAIESARRDQWAKEKLSRLEKRLELYTRHEAYREKVL